MLNAEQDAALSAIREYFGRSQPVLLFGVTASGKTEVYSHLIREYLEQGKQVLYLVPEIALTAQLIRRLQALFGEGIAPFHSRQSQHERAEVWYHVQAGGEKASIILGGNKVSSKKIMDAGFKFKFDKVNDALYNIIKLKVA